MSDESYEQYVERRRSDKGISRRQTRHLWLVMVIGVAFYGCTSWISNDMDRAVEAQETRRHGTGANPWALEKAAPQPGQRRAQ
jgi:hypothetical protein